MTRTTARLAPRPPRLGFSIIEVLFVLIIIGIMGSIVGYNLIGMAANARIAATKASMATVQGALKSYYLEYTAYPPTGLLQTLVDTKRLDTVPVDAWNQPFEYYSPTTSFAYELISLGEDKLPQTADDLNAHPAP